jgi:FkbM family methyltransferase
VYPDFVAHARRLLRDRGVSLQFIDVGSRNGVIELAALAEFVDAYGFEPNPDEYRKLMAGTTDASIVGQVSPPYRSLRFSPLAVGDAPGHTRFFVTRGPGAAGLLEPNPEVLRQIRWKGREFAGSFAEEVFTVQREIEVEVVTLRDFARDAGIDHVDYLKIDVEGSEYEVLVGADDLLRRTGVVKVEVCFVEFRHGQRLFSDIDLYLRARGFDLLRYEILPEQIGFKERTAGWTFGSALGFPERYGQPLQGDAIYVNGRITDRDRALAQAMVLLDLRYLDEALHILRTRAGIREDRLLQGLATFRGTLPHRAADRAARLLLALRSLAAPVRTFRRWQGWRELERRGIAVRAGRTRRGSTGTDARRS